MLPDRDLDPDLASGAAGRAAKIEGFKGEGASIDGYTKGDSGFEGVKAKEVRGMRIGTAELAMDMGSNGIMVSEVEAIGEATEGADVEDIDASGEVRAVLEDQGIMVVGEDHPEGVAGSGVIRRGRWWATMIWHPGGSTDDVGRKSPVVAPVEKRMLGSTMMHGRHAGYVDSEGVGGGQAGEKVFGGREGR